MVSNEVDSNPYEFKRSRSFSDREQWSLWLNILKFFLQEANMFITITYLNLLITRAEINSDEFKIWLYCAYTLELLAIECLNSPF